MGHKKFLHLFLLAAVVQIYAFDREDTLNDERSGPLEQKEFYAQKKRHEKWQHQWPDYVDVKNRGGLGKDNKWNKKIHLQNSIKTNEIQIDDDAGNYNKYGKTFRGEDIDKKLRMEKNNHERNPPLNFNQKPPQLLSDTNVNYINNIKKINEDAEILETPSKPPQLLNDTNVNYINNIKQINKDHDIKNPRKSYKKNENYEKNYQNANEMYFKRHKKNFYQNLKKLDFSQPPTNNTILMARYLVHTVDWAVLGTLSGRPPTKNTPFVCVKAISDGINGSATGIPFFYLSPLDLCTQDLQKDNRVSLIVTLSETEYCKNNDLDPQDPRCAKMTLSGKIKKIKAGSDEEKFAKNALFTRHPVMGTWPKGHNWYFAKLKIGQIVLLDEFGGAKYINVKDYLNGGYEEEPKN